MVEALPDLEALAKGGTVADALSADGDGRREAEQRAERRVAGCDSKQEVRRMAAAVV
jgi:hypothetical protein